jgi:anti-anti-sigma regulatory factor
MIPRLRNVTLRRLPERMNAEQARSLFRELVSCLDCDRPRVVINCSRLRDIDWPVIHLLLCCLEEALKRNGDVRLAAIPEEVLAGLQFMGADRLFRIFDTNTEAVMSFQRPIASEAAQIYIADAFEQVPESAA